MYKKVFLKPAYYFLFFFVFRFATTLQMAKVKINKISFRASIAENSFNKEERTVDVTFATDTPVKRYDWDIEGGYFNEVLGFDKANIRMERINAGAPVLNSHSNYELSNVLGVVTKAWIEEGVGRATLKFSDRDDVAPFVKDIENGIIRNVSVGYKVHKYDDVSEDDDKIPTLRAIDWEPYEISMVAIPADYKSTVRSEEVNETEVEILIKKQMAKKNKKPYADMTPDEKRDYDAKQKRIADAKTALRNEAAADERKRISDIDSIFRTAKMDLEDEAVKAKYDGFIANGKTVGAVRKWVFEERMKLDEEKNNDTRGNQQPITKITGKEEAEKRYEAIGDAVLMRANPGMVKDAATGKEKQLTDEGKKYRFMPLMDIAKELMREEGVDFEGRSAMEIAQMALTGSHRNGRPLVDASKRAYMGISDFPIILGNTINRSLMMMYDLYPRTFQEFCRKSTAKDFRPMTKVRTGDVTPFDLIKENEEYVAGNYNESKEVYSVLKYGKKINLSWESLINDDLDAFGRIPMNIAQGAAQKQSDLVWNILTGNPAMGDTVNLFDAAHSNYIASGSGGAINISTLSAARALMRKQQSMGDKNGKGKYYLNIEPKYLIVSPDMELAANEFTSVNYVPVDQVKINPAYNTSLKVIVEPRLQGLNNGLAWFLAASPQNIETIEYSFLEGDGELFTETKMGFEVDGIETKARMVFGCKALDWKGFVQNFGS